MSPASDDLARTRVLFEQWRATRQGCAKIPDELWQAVVALHGRYSASQLCRELRLSAAALREHLSPVSAEKTRPSPTFVPLSPAGSSQPIPSVPLTTPVIRLAWERADGTRLLVSVLATQWAQVESLCTTFFHS
jgi:hypothetical protein